MKNWLSVGLTTVAMVGAATLTPLFAADPAPSVQVPNVGDMGGTTPSPGAMESQKLTAVEITNVDKAKGTVEIKKKEGSQETLKLDDSAKTQLDKVQKGDKVDIEVVDRNGEKFAKSLMKAS